jgi:putative aldouronate transport system substrate-binding protein
MKRILSLAMVLLLCLALLPQTFAVAEQSDLKPVTLHFIFFGDKKADTDKVWAAIAEKYRDVLNCDFDVQFIAGDDYKQKLLVKAAAGDVWDLNFDGNWLGYYQMTALGAYMDLTDLLPEYAPDLYAAYQESGALKSASYQGKIVCLPWTIVMNNRTFFQWRGDLAKAAGLDIDAASITTFEDVDGVLQILKAAYPDRYILEAASLDGTMMEHNLVDIGNSLVVDLSDPDHTVQPLEQTAAYLEFARWAKKWQDEDIIWKDVLTDLTDHNALIDQGKLISKWGTLEFATQNRAWVEEGAYWDYNALYPDSLSPNRTPLANVVAIPDTSENPERTLMFLNLLETDQDLYDMVHYGILGETYELDNAMAVYPEGMTSANSSYMEWLGRWGLWKPQFMRPDASYGPGFWDNQKTFALSNPNNIDNPLEGFSFDKENVSIEAAQRDQIHTDMNKIISVGLAGDADAAVQSLIEQQKVAGVDIIVAEAQKQIDEFFASKGE